MDETELQHLGQWRTEGWGRRRRIIAPGGISKGGGTSKRGRGRKKGTRSRSLAEVGVIEVIICA